MEAKMVDPDPAEVLPSRQDKSAVALVVVGMAGSGKTTFVTALFTYLVSTMKKKVYTINLDPAVLQVPFPANIDIRDTINYKKTMEGFGLGPNGAILTCLNLFSTRFDKVLDLLATRKAEYDYVLIDTPGQIEVFNWSASGTIILDSLSVTLPTQVIFTVDALRCQRPATLMSTMLYGCSILYKSKLPFLNVFTKTDLVDPQEQFDMLSNFEAFSEKATAEDTYAASMWKSCSLLLSPFYEEIPRCSVAVIGDTSTLRGFGTLVEKIDGLKEDYFDHYIGWIMEERKRIRKERVEAAEEEYKKFAEDAK